MRIEMNLSNRYDIIIEENLIDNIEPYLTSLNLTSRNLYFIVDSNVYNLYFKRVKECLKNYNIKEIIVEGNESSKSIESYELVSEKLISLGIKRKNLLITFGGGVVGDLGGFIASTLYRGIDYIQIPTTLLSQIDSSIGGKVAINLKNGKNMLGSFYQPRLVLIDPSLLSTLPKKEIVSGMGELIKHGLIGNSKLLEMLDGDINENLIYESLLVKKSIVEQDEFDEGKRMILNFGHTFGHAIEKKYGYGYYSHGQAVGYGMLLALKYGERIGITNREIYPLLEKLLVKYGFEINNIDFDDELKETMKNDKKNIAGVINLVLLKNIGDAIIYQVLEDSL